MTIIPRRQIDELITLHEKEPKLRDIIVEGIKDKHFVQWFLSSVGLGNVSVYEVATIEVGPELIARAGIDTGARGRVIALAEALEPTTPARDHVTCIADSDFDFIENVHRECSALLTTDFTAMELYAYNDRTISKVLKLVVSGFPKSASSVLKQLTEPLQEMFLLRAANHMEGLGLNFETPNSGGFFKSLWIKDGVLQFDADKYLTALLQSSGATTRRQQILDRIAKLRPQLKSDPRFQIHGHDFEQALAFFVRKLKGFGGTYPEIIICSLMAAIDLDILEAQPLFIELKKRCSSAPLSSKS